MVGTVVGGFGPSAQYFAGEVGNPALYRLILSGDKVNVHAILRWIGVEYNFLHRICTNCRIRLHICARDAWMVECNIAFVGGAHHFPEPQLDHFPNISIEALVAHIPLVADTRAADHCQLRPGYALVGGHVQIQRTHCAIGCGLVGMPVKRKCGGGRMRQVDAVADQMRSGSRGCCIGVGIEVKAPMIGRCWS